MPLHQPQQCSSIDINSQRHLMEVEDQVYIIVPLGPCEEHRRFGIVLRTLSLLHHSYIYMVYMIVNIRIRLVDLASALTRHHMCW